MIEEDEIEEEVSPCCCVGKETVCGKRGEGESGDKAEEDSKDVSRQYSSDSLCRKRFYVRPADIAVERQETADDEESVYEYDAVAQETLVPCGEAEMIAEDAECKQIPKESETVFLRYMV